ncbi:Uncharacterized protein Fot_14185 [Forsythia ovata]|uniref:Uncharacterized protein n=1 Tax=Forsythia ovata TaxID=205694 RepID=A0ABD1W5W2_9LAMI
MCKHDLHIVAQCPYSQTTKFRPIQVEGDSFEMQLHFCFLIFCFGAHWSSVHSQKYAKPPDSQLHPQIGGVLRALSGLTLNKTVMAPILANPSGHAGFLFASGWWCGTTGGTYNYVANDTEHGTQNYHLL